jgi:amino acid transporter
MTERQDNDEEDDRQLNELVQELRLVLPGTTVLFAFLLSVPFSSRFEQLTRLDRLVYFVAFIASALALTFLLAEAGYHRVRGRPYDKQVMIRTTSKQAVVGLAMLGLALVCCVVLICDFVYGPVVAWTVSVPLGLGALGMWFGLPLARRWRGDPRPADRSPTGT